ncbi:MAG: hypothetical protein J6K51_04070 [Clostridia bacterium]|nr:hypothetical protein [Clostridia bacterium]
MMQNGEIEPFRGHPKAYKGTPSGEIHPFGAFYQAVFHKKRAIGIKSDSSYFYER